MWTRMSPREGTAPLALVYRRVSLTVAAFDRLKALQRELERSTARRWTNGQVLDFILVSRK